MDATHLYWPAKAAALATLARRGAGHRLIQAIAASLALAGLPARAAAAVVRAEVAARVAYAEERGDRFDEAPTVLARRVDDCDGHAIVGAAIAAASGFGARIVGVSHPGQRQPVHVRAELSDDGITWWPADSTPAARVWPVVLHRPVAQVSDPRPAPAPVGFLGLFDVPILDDLIDAGADIVGAIVDRLGLGGASDWIQDEVARVVRDPRLLAVAVSTAAACLGAPVACGPALTAAQGLLVAEAVHRYGPDAWAHWTADRVASAVESARRATPPAVWAAGLQVAAPALDAARRQWPVLADPGDRLAYSAAVVDAAHAVQAAAVRPTLTDSPTVRAAARRRRGGLVLPAAAAAAAFWWLRS